MVQPMDSAAMKPARSSSASRCGINSEKIVRGETAGRSARQCADAGVPGIQETEAAGAERRQWPGSLPPGQVRRGAGAGRLEPATRSAEATRSLGGSGHQSQGGVARGGEPGPAWPPTRNHGTARQRPARAEGARRQGCQWAVAEVMSPGNRLGTWPGDVGLIWAMHQTAWPQACPRSGELSSAPR